MRGKDEEDSEGDEDQILEVTLTPGPLSAEVLESIVWVKKQAQRGLCISPRSHSLYVPCRVQSWVIGLQRPPS